MGLTVVCGLLMATWLFKHASQQKGIKALAGFNFFMALWCCGHWLLSMNYSSAGQALLSLNPMMPTLFLHFSLWFVSDRVENAQVLKKILPYMPITYVLSLSVVIASIGFSGNTFEPWLDFPLFLHLGQVGWINLLYTVFIGLFGHGVLLWGYANSQDNTRRTIMMLFGSGAWGFTLATSYILPSLGLDFYPYLMWFLPSYLLLITFAVLRYQVFAVNYWAIKTIIWAIALLALLGLTTLLTSMASQMGLAHLSAIPLSIIWLYSITSGLTLWLLYNPLHKLASRLVYPDVKLTEQIIDNWLLKLNTSQSFEQLQNTATELMSSFIHQPVIIALKARHNTEQLLIECFTQNNEWRFELKNWHNVTPGIRHVAEIFAPLLYTSCVNLDKSLRLAEQEKQRQEELRLVELGSLSASIAHELRNPLNIISMASAQCDDKVKKHIQSQLKRADTLIQDLLSYARVIELNCQNIVLLPLLNAVGKNIAEQHKITLDIQCPEQLMIYADVYKLQQVLVNLLDNGAVFGAMGNDGTLTVQAKAVDNNLQISFHNNGPAITPVLQSELFKPFISKRVGGSGLGLAIVQRIMKAHNGSIIFSEQLGWNVSFVCTFPAINKEHKE